MMRAPVLELAFPSPAPPVSSYLCGGKGFSAEYVVLTSDSPYEFKSRGDDHYLAFHDLKLRDGELKIDSLPVIRERDLRDSITFVPKGCGFEGWSHPEARHNSFLAMHFDPELIREDLGARYSPSPAPIAYGRSAELRSTLGKLQGLLIDPAADPLRAESLCLLASLEVFGVIADPQNSLSPRQVSAVTDYVEDHIHAPISLADLAGVAGLSRFHFSRAFKAATGQSPSTFVQKRRIDRAAALLRGGDLPIELIARSVGFAGVPQFRRAFGQILNTSPSKYRKQHR